MRQPFPAKLLSSLAQLFPRDALMLVAANMTSSALGFLVVVVTSRALGPAKFGLYALATTFTMIVANLSEFGFGTSLVRFMSPLIAQDEERARFVLHQSARIKLLGTSAVVLICVLLRGQLAALLGIRDATWVLDIGIAAAFATSMFAFVSLVFQAYQHFNRLALLSLSTNLIRCVGSALLIAAALSNLDVFLWLFATAPLVSAVLAVRWLPAGVHGSSREAGNDVRNLLAFSKWTWLKLILTVLLVRSDLFFLSYFVADKAVVGTYAAGAQLAIILQILVASLGAVLLPKASRLEGTIALRRYISTNALRLSALACVLALAVPLAGWLVPFIFGSVYEQAVPVFRVLYSSLLLNLIVEPVAFVIYVAKRPEVLASVSAVQLVMCVVGYIAVVPSHGALGAALVFGFVNAVGLGFTLFYIYLHFYRTSEPGTLRTDSCA